MTEGTPLHEAVAALRAIRADHEEALTTERRVLQTLQTRARGRRATLRLVAGLGLGLFLAAGSQAAYYGTDEVIRQVTSWVRLQTQPERHGKAHRKEPVSVGRAEQRGRGQGAPRAPTALPVEQPAAAAVIGAEAVEPVQPSTSTSAPILRPAPRATVREVVRSEVDAEELYTEAHRLHFVDGDKLAALEGWNRYLAAQPSGGLAPEARYNRALCLIALGRTQQALDALTSIAEGSDGDYRLREARQLLRALSRARPP